MYPTEVVGQTATLHTIKCPVLRNEPYVPRLLTRDPLYSLQCDEFQFNPRTLPHSNRGNAQTKSFHHYRSWLKCWSCRIYNFATMKHYILTVGELFLHLFGIFYEICYDSKLTKYENVFSFFLPNGVSKNVPKSLGNKYFFVLCWFCLVKYL